MSTADESGRWTFFSPARAIENRKHGEFMKLMNEGFGARALEAIEATMEPLNP